MDVLEFRKQRNRICNFYENCSNCTHAEKDMGIKEVWFTTENGFGYEWMED